MHENTELHRHGVGVHDADIEFDKANEGPMADPSPDLEADSLREETRRAFAIEQAATVSANIDELISNAEKILTFLEGNNVTESNALDTTK